MRNLHATLAGMERVLVVWRVLGLSTGVVVGMGILKNDKLRGCRVERKHHLQSMVPSASFKRCKGSRSLLQMFNETHETQNLAQPGDIS